jgi:hypothetical protein
MTRIDKGLAREPRAESPSLYHVMHCEPCRVRIWSEIVFTALHRARVAPVEPPLREALKVMGVH